MKHSQQAEAWQTKELTSYISTNPINKCYANSSTISSTQTGESIRAMPSILEIVEVHARLAHVSFRISWGRLGFGGHANSKACLRLRLIRLRPG